MTTDPAPYGATPSPRQRAWHALERYGFIHFTVNTFTDREWGYGDEPPALFDPSDFDADQIVAAARAGGLRGLILTAKHHDGFCLWPSAHTSHSVRAAPWRGGQGDVVRELGEACRRAGLQFGVYLSPWDRNHPEYGRPAYISYYRAQLRELLTGYGPLFEVWFDGANGGDGYYGGAREQRAIDRRSYYGWETTWGLVRELQPGACIFSDAGPDVRWVGNEHGVAPETSWATIDLGRLAPGEADPAELGAGQPGAPHWAPAECDVSIRPGWFYHAAEDARVKPPEQLVELYFASVGRGSALLLNLPPDRRGRVHERDVAALAGFASQVDAIFATNLAAGGAAAADSAHSPRYRAEHLLDGDPERCWCAAEGARSATLTLTLARPARVGVVSLREHLPLGQRITAFAIDAERDGRWEELARGTTIGARRLLRLPPTRTGRLRLRITGALAAPALSEWAVFEAIERPGD